jgi:hypothetical protein
MTSWHLPRYEDTLCLFGKFDIHYCGQDSLPPVFNLSHTKPVHIPFQQHKFELSYHLWRWPYKRSFPFRPPPHKSVQTYGLSHVLYIPCPYQLPWFYLYAILSILLSLPPSNATSPQLLHLTHTCQLWKLATMWEQCTCKHTVLATCSLPADCR